MRLLAFCEAPADFRIASDLLDRVLRASGPPWVGEVMDAAPEGIREWQPDGRGSAFFDIHAVDKYLEALKLKAQYGFFNRQPAAFGAAMARNVFRIARRLVERGEAIDAVVLVWDLDDQPTDRLRGLEQAFDEARGAVPFEIVRGCPNAKREAWVIAGFVPDGEEEHARLAQLRRELGFNPTEEAHRLDAGDEQAKRNAKRVLAMLTLDDAEREERCWVVTELDVLKARGADNGLADYLEQIERLIVPLCTARK